MKNLKYLIGLLVMTALTACHTYDEPTTHSYVEEGSPEEWTATMTIDAFLNNPAYFSEFGNVEKYPPRARSYSGASTSGTNLGLFSVEDISADIIIVGRIVSTDVSGNIYKNIYIQDCEKPDYGIKIGIDAGSIGGMYAIGQKIAFKLKGLAIGKYAKMPQIGVPYYNNAKEGLDNPAKAGWEIGRIPLSIFTEHVQMIGRPEPAKIIVKEMKIEDIKATATDYKNVALLSSRLVRISNISFVPYTWDTYGRLSALSGTYACSTDPNANTFAPTTGGIGYPQSRCFGSPTDTLAIGTSEYSKFACAPLPSDEYRGSVTGMVSFYYDNGAYDLVTNKVWTITINGLDDLILKNTADELWEADPVYYPAY